MASQQQPTTQTAEVVNLTSLAKMMHASTPAARAKLDKLGLEPVSEITMPNSGRTYTLYRKEEALSLVKKLEEQKNPPVRMNTTKPAAQAIEVPKSVTADIQELKGMVSLLVQAVQNAKAQIDAQNQGARRGRKAKAAADA